MARAEIAESARSEIAQFEGSEELPIVEEKAVPRSVLKKTTAVSRYSKHRLLQKQKSKEELAQEDGKQKSQYNKRMGKTLKGIKYEAQQKETTTTVAPKTARLRSQETVPAVTLQAPQQHENEEEEELHEEETQENAEESNDESDSWLHVGAKVEWNPMVGKKAKYLLKENDWIEVTVVDKEEDNGVYIYGIQKGQLQTRVPHEQLRKAVKAKRLAEEKKREEAFWAKRKPTTAPDDGLEDVMVPLKAKAGRTCRGNPTRLSADKSEYHEDGDAIDAEDCRNLCEKNSKCKFASHGMYKMHEDAKATLSCLSFETCDETTGKGFRSWQKARMDSGKANKARTSERREDEYMAKIKEAEEIALQRLQADLMPANDAANQVPVPAPTKALSISPDSAIIITGSRSKMVTEDSFMAIPFWRHLLELGAIAVLFFIWNSKMQQSKRRKQAGACVTGQHEMKEPNALNKLHNWIQRETKPVVTMLQKLISPPKIPSDTDIDAAAASASVTRKFEKASEFLDDGEQKNTQTQRKYQTPPPEDDGARDQSVNRSALRAAFKMAGNTRTADFR
eukprot:gnl/MRDRNA2_/MRDRNA2_95558_c0_seq1.p1 gnl/MRDRNA2_/MRDRNA2_95558_c0~~gnl/MRDRNA2_/MRDRNA2_95558_c0_seq1.p1  ORF type:complete len:628 (-),score=191.14 gnl/MRDRNA2_/MRDRNA2_95558_c0_seq1:11-1705(-)